MERFIADAHKQAYTTPPNATSNAGMSKKFPKGIHVTRKSQ